MVVPSFEFKEKGFYFILSSYSIFLNSKTSIVTNLKPSNPINKSMSLYLIADSVSLNFVQD